MRSAWIPQVSHISNGECLYKGQNGEATDVWGEAQVSRTPRPRLRPCSPRPRTAYKARRDFPLRAFEGREALPTPCFLELWEKKFRCCSSPSVWHFSYNSLRRLVGWGLSEMD